MGCRPSARSTPRAVIPTKASFARRRAGLQGQPEGRGDGPRVGPPLPLLRVRPQLPALLALQEARHLPGDRAMVRRGRPRRPPGQNARRHQRRGAMASVVGPVADRGDGLAPARLVHQPTAGLGSADPRPRLRVVRDATPDRRDRSPLPRPLPARRGRRLVLEARRRDPRPPAPPARNAAGPPSARKGTSSTSGSNPVRATGPS